MLLVLESGEDKIINRTALRKDVRLQVLEDSIVDFDLVDGQFVSYGCGRLERPQEWRALDYNTLVATSLQVVAHELPRDVRLRDAQMRQWTVVLVLNAGQLLRQVALIGALTVPNQCHKHGSATIITMFTTSLVF